MELLKFFSFSCNMKLNLDYLLETLWDKLSLIRVYTKKPGEPPDFQGGLILRRGCSVEHVCHAIHRSIAQHFKYAIVWVRINTKIKIKRIYDNLPDVFFSKFPFQGTSTKYSPQRVGHHHIMHDEDVIRIVKK